MSLKETGTNSSYGTPGISGMGFLKPPIFCAENQKDFLLQQVLELQPVFDSCSSVQTHCRFVYVQSSLRVLPLNPGQAIHTIMVFYDWVLESNRKKLDKSGC
jgi:hypothetical protein